jgi:hypothetical protein
VRCGPENLLNVATHIKSIQKLVALVQDEAFHVVELEDLREAGRMGDRDG